MLSVIMEPNRRRELMILNRSVDFWIVFALIGLALVVTVLMATGTIKQPTESQKEKRSRQVRAAQNS